jgi:AcrR family transcriptional regulator
LWQDGAVSVTVPPEGLRERKKARTREALERTALELFTRQGFDHTTIEDIAEACEVSPRTFFRYFSSKLDVLYGGEPEGRRHRMLALLAVQPDEMSPLEALRGAVLSIADEYARDRDRLAARMAVIESSPSLRASKSEAQRGWEDAVVEQLTAREQKAGSGRDLLELRLVAATGTAALRAALDAWLAGPKSASLSELINEAFDRLAAGLDQPPRRPRRH